MLYRPDAFEELTETPWQEAEVQAGIARIVAAAEQEYDPDSLWPVVDPWDGEPPVAILHSGAAGAVWALDALRRRGYETGLDLAAAAMRALEVWRSAPAPERLEPPVRTHASLYGGESGILFVASLVEPSDELADALFERVSENVATPAPELLHGPPGTMIAAKAMLDRTGEERWATVWRDGAEALWRARDADGLWLYEPYGRGLGAAHGAATNANVLLQGGHLLSSEWAEALRQETGRAYARFAVVEDGRANWPMTTEAWPELVAWDDQIRLQWCHGGAGVVASAAGYLEEDLLLAGAELVWEAGPPSMEKGPGICHGTAGSGYAFLKVFERTGDERWLERARRFSVHALEQVERWRAHRGAGRSTLWTGDLGAALFAADCLDASAAMPILDRV